MIAKSTETQTEQRLCQHCLTVKPLTDFRRMSSKGDRRFNQCNRCHYDYENARRAKKRERREKRRVGSSLIALKNARSRREVELVTNAMLREFGGAEGFVVAYREYFRLAAERGSPFMLHRCVQGLLKLLEYRDQSRPAPAKMTDSDIAAELQAAFVRQVQQQPDVAADVLRSLGWTAVPPDAS